VGIGDWGLGIGDWGLGIGPNPQSPIPKSFFLQFKLKNIAFSYKNNIINKFKYLFYEKRRKQSRRR